METSTHQVEALIQDPSTCRARALFAIMKTMIQKDQPTKDWPRKIINEWSKIDDELFNRYLQRALQQLPTNVPASAGMVTPYDENIVTKLVKDEIMYQHNQYDNTIAVASVEELEEITCRREISINQLSYWKQAIHQIDCTKTFISRFKMNYEQLPEKEGFPDWLHHSSTDQEYTLSGTPRKTDEGIYIAQWVDRYGEKKREEVIVVHDPSH